MLEELADFGGLDEGVYFLKFLLRIHPGPSENVDAIIEVSHPKDMVVKVHELDAPTLSNAI